MKCRRCELVELDLSRPGAVHVCEACFAGLARFNALARRRPWLFSLSGPARECLVWFETARLEFTRSLRPRGVHVVWRGFTPEVKVIPRVVGSGETDPC